MKKTLATLTLAAAIALSTALPAHAGYAFVTGDGYSPFHYYVDPSTIEHTGSTYTVWIRTVLNPVNAEKRSELRERAKRIYQLSEEADAEKITEANLYAYDMELWEVDFKRRRYRTLSRSAYTSAGDVISWMSYSPENPTWNYLVPNSYGDTVLQFLRKYR